MIVKDVLFDSDSLAIYFEAESKLIHLKWKGFASSDNFRDGLNFALAVVKEHQVENWLGNLKLMESILPADEEWTTKVWYPKIAETTLKKMAIVTSLDYFNNTAVKRIVSTSEPVINFETRYFIDIVPAKEWLIS